MKTNEFIEIMENYGYTVNRSYGSIYVGNNDTIIMEVLEHKFASVDTNWSEFDALEKDEQENILEVAYTYITTPIEEREETKKYYLRLKDELGGVVDKKFLYLNYHKSYKKYSFYTIEDDVLSQTQFTQAEIDKIDTTHLIKEEVEWCTI